MDGGIVNCIPIHHSPILGGGNCTRSITAPPKLTQSLIAEYFHPTKRMDGSKRYAVVEDEGWRYDDEAIIEILNMMEDERNIGGMDKAVVENATGPVEITTEDGGTSEDDWAKSGSDEDDLLEITWRMENRGDDDLQQRTSSNPAPCLPGGLEKDEDAKVPDGEPGSTTPVVGVAPPSLSRVVTTTSTVDQRCNVLRRTTNFVIRVVSDSSSEDDTGSGMVDPGHVMGDNGMNRSSPDADIPDFIPATPESSSGRNRTVRQRTGKQLTFSFINHDVIATGDKKQLKAVFKGIRFKLKKRKEE